VIEMAGLVYSIDSSSLINAWWNNYRPKNFSVLWDRLTELAEGGRLKSSIEVLNELEKKEDELFKWCKERKDALFVPIDEACQNEMVRIMATYPRLVDAAKGRSGADPFVIALATSVNPTMTVVTEEKPGKVKIPDVCAAETIKCIRLADLIGMEDWRF
jgi:Domain of unknown function (DUF4411)